MFAKKLRDEPNKNIGSHNLADGMECFNVQRESGLTSQNNSLPLRPQNQDIQDTSSELLMVLPTTTAAPSLTVHTNC